MTDREQQIAIAELAGWSNFEVANSMFAGEPNILCGTAPGWKEMDAKALHRVPDYTNDPKLLCECVPSGLNSRNEIGLIGSKLHGLKMDSPFQLPPDSERPGIHRDGLRLWLGKRKVFRVVASRSEDACLRCCRGLSETVRSRFCI